MLWWCDYMEMSEYRIDSFTLRHPPTAPPPSSSHMGGHIESVKQVQITVTFHYFAWKDGDEVHSSMRSIYINRDELHLQLIPM